MLPVTTDSEYNQTHKLYNTFFRHITKVLRSVLNQKLNFFLLGYKI